MPKGHTVSKWQSQDSNSGRSRAHALNYIMTKENVNHLSVREKSQVKNKNKNKNGLKTMIPILYQTFKKSYDYTYKEKLL